MMNKLASFMVLAILATTVVVDNKGKSYPVYEGRTPLAYKKYRPQSVRNRQALEEAGLTIPTPIDQGMLDYIKEKNEKEEKEDE